MKKLTFTVAMLLVAATFASQSFAEWTTVGESVSGNTYYVDFDRIRKNDGYIYFWTLTDYAKPTKNKRLSGKVYNQGDCKVFRYKFLSDTYYNEPMGNGEIKSGSDVPDKEWSYPQPNSVFEVVLKTVCSK